MSAGAGPYAAITQNDDQTGDGRLSGLFSVSASYRFATRWLARVTWNRIATRYDRDVDLILAGLGVQFQARRRPLDERRRTLELHGPRV